MSVEENNTADVHEEEKSSPEPVDTNQVKEQGGRQGLEPTRYGDWEKKGRCIDF